MNLPTHPTQSTIARNPHLYSPQKQVVKEAKSLLLNKTEARYCAILEAQGYKVMKQAIRLRMDVPYKSYTPDLAYVMWGKLVLVEVKAPHRFREKGIAKAALAAKTYPSLTFLLAEWTGSEWKETLLSA